MSGSISRGLALSTMAVLLLATPLLSGVPAFADETVAKPEVTSPKATYDETQPGADDPRVKEGFAAYQAGEFKKAYDIWLPLAEAGNAEAQFRVGRLYSFGEGVGQNYREALSYYLSAEENGHLVAASNLGAIFLRGKLGIPDEKSARMHFLKAAIGGDAEAQRALGVLMLLGLGGSPNTDEGLVWLLASDAGGVDASDALVKLKKYYNSENMKLAQRKLEEWRKGHSPYGEIIFHR